MSAQYTGSPVHGAMPESPALGIALQYNQASDAFDLLAAACAGGFEPNGYDHLPLFNPADDSMEMVSIAAAAGWDDDSALQEGDACWARHTVEIPTLRPVAIEAPGPTTSGRSSLMWLAIAFVSWGVFCLLLGARVGHSLLGSAP